MSLAIQVCVPIIVALTTLTAGYGLNQFPAIKGLSSKWGSLIRSTVWLVLSTAVLTVLISDTASAAVKHRLGYVGVALVVAILYEICSLVWAIWQLKRGVPEELSLQDRLVGEVRFRVGERLQYAVGQRDLIELPVEPVPEEVGGVDRGADEYMRFRLLWNRELKVRQGERNATVEVGIGVLEAFEHEFVQQKLLILGEPGSGKTTTLLKLAEALLAQEKGRNQFPYIFELSAWKDDRQALLPWMVEQLKFDYGINPKEGERWIRNRQLVPLLDGLDELGAERQKKCVEKINAFAAVPGQPVVVCCRSEEYAEGAVRLTKLNGALCLQPLSDEQIEQYFSRLKRLDIWQAIQNQPELRSLLSRSVTSQREGETPFLRVPLFLRMLAVVYQADGQESKPITTKTELFDEYIKRQLSLAARKQSRQSQSDRPLCESWAYVSVKKEPSNIKTKQYLSWLAKRLNEDKSANNFLIEQMQPSWLEQKQPDWLTFSFSTFQYWILSNLLSLIALGSPTFLFALMFGRPLSGVAGGFLIALFPTLIGSLNVNWNHIERVESIKILSAYKSRRKILSISLWSLPFLAFTVFLMGALISATPDVTLSFSASILCSLLLFLFIWVLIVPVGFAKEELKIRRIPNQGVLASAKNFLLSFLSLCFVSLLAGLVYNYSIDEPIFPNLIVNAGLMLSAIPCFYVFGGISVVQHIALRIVLSRQGHIPHNYAKFLKYTTERRLTQQIGGRFRFIHRELLDHFAAMGADTSEKS